MKEKPINTDIFCNISNFSSTEFGEFLFRSKLVAAGKEKFMVIWVRKFFAFQQRLPKMPWPEQLPLFLQDLNIAGAFKEWQIRQADWAVRLYFNNFMMAHPSAKDQQIPPSKNAASEQGALQSFG
jgi:hypothetical protein